MPSVAYTVFAGNTQRYEGSTVSSVSRKTVAWVAGAALAAGGCVTGIVLATGSSGQSAPSQAGSTAIARAAAAKPTVPLQLVSVTPASDARDVIGTEDITVTYNQPLPVTAPMPAISPALAGAWERTGDTAVFTPATGLPEDTSFKVTVPGLGASAARTASTISFKTAAYSTLRLQQILSQLGYLPLTWTPAAGAASPGASVAAQLSAAYSPPAGAFGWKSGYPSSLRQQWALGKANTLDTGAVAGFEADHGLTPDGNASPAVWTALLTAAAKDQQNTHGYSYAIAGESLPETLTIWHNGARVFSSAANTGIGAAPTARGTYFVYEKLPFQIMSGTNPDGSHYADPVQWVSYFDGGEAVHYFPRGSYGWPQSLGCVELSYDAAKRAYPYLPYGTLVTVAG
jgi:peptidoglycan hydrolase-like protein with peptidoglycan-binding domain